ncbi:MAG TPA: hypothetical protein VKR21_11540 [Solirubrobacteraceae bacterium]|nr:hypothetical protein [Solirubrobacteraceae bacterium]
MALPPGHGQTIAAPPALSGRERRLIAGVLVLAAALTVALVISLAVGGRSSAHGCIHATIPGAVGAQEIDQCGGQARATCRGAEQSGAFTVSSARVIAAECRKAGLPVG